MLLPACLPAWPGVLVSNNLLLTNKKEYGIGMDGISSVLSVFIYKNNGHVRQRDRERDTSLSRENVKACYWFRARSIGSCR